MVQLRREQNKDEEFENYSNKPNLASPVQKSYVFQTQRQGERLEHVEFKSQDPSYNFNDIVPYH